MSQEDGVAPRELLARFILYRDHIRRDRTIKPDALIPHPHQDLSVTRHLHLSGAELWQLGHDVAEKRGKTLRGRADLTASAFQAQKLQVLAAPVSGNSNHANVAGWPQDKPAQKMIAQELAVAAGKALLPLA
ncbi:MAG: hypothetical protein AB1634_07985 [Thermodesulfobacteriota bacterium]